MSGATRSQRKQRKDGSWRLQREHSPAHPLIQASDPQNFERVNSYCFKPPSLASLNFEAVYSILGNSTWICLLGDKKVINFVCVC